MLHSSSSFYDVTSETLTTVKNVEESLKRLKMTKKSAALADDGPSDEEKIRAQIGLDIEEFGRQVSDGSLSLTQLITDTVGKVWRQLADSDCL
jgi:hypothetical protein